MKKPFKNEIHSIIHDITYTKNNGEDYLGVLIIYKVGKLLKTNTIPNWLLETYGQVNGFGKKIKSLTVGESYVLVRDGTKYHNIIDVENSKEDTPFELENSKPVVEDVFDDDIPF